MQYKFTIRRNITVVCGDSATGKTTLIEMIQEYNNNGSDSGVSISCDKECVVLSGRSWQQDLKRISGAIVFIDEGNRFMLTDEFAQAIKKTDNYYVLITRECLPNIPLVLRKDMVSVYLVSMDPFNRQFMKCIIYTVIVR